MMESETCVEGTITLDEGGSTTNNAQAVVEDIVPHRMIVANGDLADGVELVASEGPKVLEMSCEAENVTENTKDLQKYASKLHESTSVDDNGATVREKQYEETALRARSEKTENAEVSSSSQMKFEETEKVRQNEGEGPAVAEYNAKCEEKHQTSVSTTENIGDSLVTRTKSSQKSVSKTCKRIEEVEGDHVDGGDKTPIGDSSARVEHAQSSSLERNDAENTIVKRMEKSHKSEKYETKIIGPDGKTQVLDKYEELLSDDNKKREGASIDLGRLGEIKLSTQISSAENTLDRDFKGVQFSEEYAKAREEEEKQSSVSESSARATSESVHEKSSKESVSSLKESRQEKHARHESKRVSVDVEGGRYDKEARLERERDYETRHALLGELRRERERAEHAQMDYLSDSSHSSYQSAKSEEAAARGGSSYRAYRKYMMAHENGDIDLHSEHDERKSRPPAFVPNDRKSADDLVKRILAESRAEKGGKKQKIKVDMGGQATGAGEDISGSPYSSLTSRETSKMSSETLAHESSSLTAHDTMSAHESLSAHETHESQETHESLAARESLSASGTSAHESLETFKERAVGAERRRTPAEDGEDEDETPSLLQRRLGVEKRLENIFAGEKEVSGTSAGITRLSAVEEFQQTYGSKRRAVGQTTEKDDFDELDQEISAMRSHYKDSMSRKYKALYGPDDEEEEPMPDSRYRPRGRMMRQEYVDDDAYYGQPPPPPEEPLLADEDFIPRRRNETEVVVKERTADIRNVVERQSNVLVKLREASESFDELTSEIRSIKQQFLENQARRSFIMDDEEEAEPMSAPVSRYQQRSRYGFSRSYSSSDAGAYQGYTSASRSVDLERELDSDTAYSGRALGTLSSYRSLGAYGGMGGEEEASSPYSSRRSGSSRFSKSGVSKWGRSKSMYDDSYGGEVDSAGEAAGVGASSRWAPASSMADGLTDKEENHRERQPGTYGGGVTATGESDYSATSYIRGNRNEDNDQSGSSYSARYSSSSYTAEYATSSPKTGYSSRFSSKPRFTRAKTLSDFNFDRPSFDRPNFDRPSSPSFSTSSPGGGSGGGGFTSRFLSKVREDRVGKGSAGSEPKSPRDKPFKSRFLRKSFDVSDYTSSASSSYSARSSSRNLSSSVTSSGAASSSVESSKAESKSSDSAATSTEAAPTESTANE